MRKQVLSLLVVMLATTMLVPMALAQTTTLSGRVTDARTGDPIAGATVVIDNHVPSGNLQPSPGIEQTTDDSGNYSFVGLVSGSWNLTMEAEGYQPEPGLVTIRSGRNSPINVALNRIPHPLEVALGPEALEGLDVEGLAAELDAADAAYENGQWEAALAGYRGLREKLPTMNDLNLSIGAALQQLERYEEAIESYEAAATADPRLRRQVDTAVARNRVAMGDLSAAETLATSGAAEREDLYNLGEVEFARGDVDAAAGWYEKAVAEDPDWALPLYKLGLVALNKGDIEGAKSYFSQVVEKDPNSAEGTQAQAVLSQLP